MSTTDDEGWGEAADALDGKPSDGAKEPEPEPEPEPESKSEPEPKPEPKPDADAGWESEAGAEPAPEAEVASIRGDAFDRELRGELEEPAPEVDLSERVVAHAPDELAPEPYTPPEVDDDLRAAVGVDKKRASKSKKTPSSRRTESSSRDSAPAKKPRRGKRGGGSGDDGGDGDDPDRPRKSRRRLIVALLLGAVSIGIAALVLVGRLNAQRYYLVCHPDKITAERGRSFPPWGRSQISGDAWQPIDLLDSVEATCDTAELSSRDELEVAYFDALVRQAGMLLAREAPEPGEIDSAEKQLRQALQLARPSERKDQRKDIGRLLGDVAYWRARRKIEGAAATLRGATKGLEEAHEANPRYVRDADEWRAFAADLATAIERGPGGAEDDGADVPERIPPGGDDEPPPDLRPDAAPGVALPPETDAGAPPVIGPPDAGIPTGGVLM